MAGHILYSLANSLFPVPNDDLFIASEFYDFGNYLLCDIDLALDLISEELFNFAQTNIQILPKRIQDLIGFVF